MSDYNTIQRRRNMVVGGFVLIAFCAFVWILMMFRNLPVVVSKLGSYEILINFPTVPGIQRDTPVQYCGYQIGRVLNVSPPFPIRLAEDRIDHRVKVTCLIDREYRTIPSNVDIKLMKRGLGSSYIEFFWDPERKISAQDLNQPQTRFIVDQMVLEGTMGVSSEFFPPEVQTKLEELIDSITALANNMNEVIGDEKNKVNIQKTLEHISKATAQAHETLKSIQNFSDKGGETALKAAEQLEMTLSELRQVLAEINSGEGSAGLMIKDPRLYNNLVDSSREMQLLLDQMKKWISEVRDKGVQIKW